MSICKRILMASAISALGFPSVVLAADAPTLSKADKEAIVQDVIEHFRRNPREIIRAITAGNAPAARTPLAETKPASAAEITPDSGLIRGNDPAYGNMSGDVTIIEFADLGCLPCRKVETAVSAAVAKDGGSRVILKDYPRSGADANEAVVMLLASKVGGGSIRRSILSAIPEDRAIGGKEMADALIVSGIEPADESAVAEAREAIARNAELAGKMGIRTLPALAVMSGDKVQVLTGPVDEATVLASISLVRSAARGH